MKSASSCLLFFLYLVSSSVFVSDSSWLILSMITMLLLWSFVCPQVCLFVLCSLRTSCLLSSVVSGSYTSNVSWWNSIHVACSPHLLLLSVFVSQSQKILSSLCFWVQDSSTGSSWKPPPQAFGQQEPPGCQSSCPALHPDPPGCRSGQQASCLGGPCTLPRSFRPVQEQHCLPVGWYCWLVVSPSREQGGEQNVSDRLL